MSAGRRLLARRGVEMTYQAYTAGPLDDEYEETWTADAPVTFAGMRQNESGNPRPIKTEDGEERFIDARIYVLADLELAYRRTGRPPEIIDGDDRLVVLRIDERKGKAFKTIRCAQQRT